MLLAKYVAQELNKIFVFLLFVLAIILLSKKMVFAVSQVAIGVMPIGIVSKIVFLYIPDVLMQILPLAWLLAIILLHQKMYAVGEYIAMLVGGFTKNHIIRLIILQGIILASVALVINLFYLSKVVAIRENLLAYGEQEAMVKSIMPGRFKVLDGGMQAFYVESMQNNGLDYKNIFIAQLPKESSNKQLVVITAQNGKLSKTSNQANQMLLRHGHKYTGTPGKLNYQMIEFKEYHRTFFQVLPKLPGFERRQSTRVLWQHIKQKENDWYKKIAMAEMQWRFSLPISIVILTFIALGITKLEVRSNSVARVIMGVIIYLVYVNLLSVTRLYVKGGLEYFQFSILVVHLLFLLLGLFCLKRAQYVI